VDDTVVVVIHESVLLLLCVLVLGVGTGVGGVSFELVYTCGFTNMSGGGVGFVAALLDRGPTGGGALVGVGAVFVVAGARGGGLVSGPTGPVVR